MQKHNCTALSSSVIIWSSYSLYSLILRCSWRICHTLVYNISKLLTSRGNGLMRVPCKHLLNSPTGCLCKEKLQGLAVFLHRYPSVWKCSYHFLMLFLLGASLVKSTQNHHWIAITKLCSCKLQNTEYILLGSHYFFSVCTNTFFKPKSMIAAYIKKSWIVSLPIDAT